MNNEEANRERTSGTEASTTGCIEKKKGDGTSMGIRSVPSTVRRCLSFENEPSRSTRTSSSSSRRRSMSERATLSETERLGTIPSFPSSRRASESCSNKRERPSSSISSLSDVLGRVPEGRARSNERTSLDLPNGSNDSEGEVPTFDAIPSDRSHPFRSEDWDRRSSSVAFQVVSERRPGSSAERVPSLSFERLHEAAQKNNP